METLRVAMLSAVFLMPAPSVAALPDPPRTDRYGDPLPKGALQRLGTARYRQDSPVTGFAWSADGTLYATAANTTTDATLRVWQTATGKEILRCSAPARIEQLAFAPDGRAVAAACGNELVLWDIATGKQLRQFQGHPNGIGCFAWSPDGKTFAVGGDLSTKSPFHAIRLLDAGGKLLSGLDTQANWVNVVVFSKDGKRFASSTRTGPVCLWDAVTAKKLHEFDCGAMHGTVVFSADLAHVAFQANDDELQVWDLAAAKELWGLARSRCSLALTPDGKRLAVGDEEGTVALLDAATGKHLFDLAAEKSRGRQVLGIDPTGKHLATAECSFYGIGCVRLWNPSTGKELTPDETHADAIALAGMTADAKHVVTAGLDGTVRLWDSGSGRSVKLLTGYRSQASSVALSQDGKTLGSIDKQGGVQLLDLPSCKPRLALGAGTATGLALAADGAVLATRDAAGNVLLWDGRSGKLLEKSNVGGGAVHFTADGRLLTLGNNKMQSWQGGGGLDFLAFGTPFEESDKPASKSSRVTYWALALSPDGRWLAASVSDGRKSEVASKLCVWEVASGRFLLDRADLPQPWAITFTPDGSTLLTSSGNVASAAGRSVLFWDLGSGQLLGTVAGHLGNVSTVAFAPNGRTFLTGGTEGSVLLWDATALPRAELPGPRKLTAAELDELWAHLSGDDARKAYQAILTMSAGGKESVAFLQDRLEAARGLTDVQLQQAIADLDNERYAVRAKATTLLATQGDFAAKALRKVLAGEGITLEMRRRVELLLPKLERLTPPPPAELRALRALAVLERVGDAQARQLIEMLAKGAPAARLTQQARATLKRLGKHQG